MGDLIMPKWLDEAVFLPLLNNEPDLFRGYDIDPYPSERTGDGNWAFLYLVDKPIGLLWMNPDANSVGLEPVDGSNFNFYTLENLRLRVMFGDGIPAYQAYQAILEKYSSTEEETGDLSQTDEYVAAIT